MKAKFLILIAALLFACFPAFAQEPSFDVTPDTTVNDLLNMFTILYAAIVNILTYIASFYKPILAVKPALRALGIGLVVGLVFFSLGIADGWQLAFGFIVAALNYDKVLKPVGLETKKAEK